MPEEWERNAAGPVLSAGGLPALMVGFLAGGAAFAQVNPDPLLDAYLDCFAAEAGLRPATAAFREQCCWASLLGWAVFMPRIVKAMQKCNAEGRQFSAWMASSFRRCMAEWFAGLRG